MDNPYGKIYTEIGRAYRQRALFEELHGELQRIYEKWGDQNHDDGTGGSLLAYEREMARLSCQHAARSGYVTWMMILREEFFEAVAESDPARVRAELIQVAGVALTWIDAIDRRQRSVGNA